MKRTLIILTLIMTRWGLSFASPALQDARGRPWEPGFRPQRIASGSLASDEVLLDAASACNQLSRLVALSSLADNKDYSNITGRAGAIKGRTGGELESLLSLKPDLVVMASFNRPEAVDRVTQSGIRTFVLGAFVTLEDIRANIRTLGQITGLEMCTRPLVEDMDARIARARQRIPASNPQLHALHLYGDGTVSGSGTLLDAILTAGGLKNEAVRHGIKGWQKLNMEAIAAMKPDLIIAGGLPAERDQILRQLQGIPGAANLTAIRQGRLVLIPPSTLAATSHYIAGAVEALADGLSPPAPGPKP